jgi:hypothetical protein
MTTNCSCSPTDYHDLTSFWFAYFKKPKICSVAGTTMKACFISRKGVTLRDINEKMNG